MRESTSLENQMGQDAVARNVEIIGEASHNIREQHSESANLPKRTTSWATV
jgi:uncharacterized protein with HEPN domain